jgi:GT2 family glycosyltransferase
MSEPPGQPAISVVILNYNGQKWLERCLESLRAQSIFDRIEVIVADNASTDGSDKLARQAMSGWPNGQFLQNGANLGFCEGNNRGAALARGEYLFFLNPDAWLERECLEVLLKETEAAGAVAANPLVLDYDDDNFQHLICSGIDLFGLPNGAIRSGEVREVFAASGCGYLIRTDFFRRIGGFDRELFMYGDEIDLSWRVWIAGGRIVAVPLARMHHRGAASANPEGGTRIVESRTNENKRFFTNRNALLNVLKNSEHVLLFLALMNLLLLTVEAAAALALVRRWSFVKRGYVEAAQDCWRLRSHICDQRKQIDSYRRRGDFGMLRFLRLTPSRWPEIKRLFQMGVPRVDSAK